MNITRGRWLTDPDGVSNGGTGLIMAARDLAKLGELYRQDGVWNGVRYLPAGYAEQVAGTASFDLPNQWDYGMLWWTTAAYGPRMWIAAGFRGQYIVVIPSLELVTVIQSESYALRGDVEDHFHLVVQYVVPAAH